MNSSTTVPRCACAAPACPMIATSSRGTTGGDDWLCFIHFAADARDHSLITAELQRLQWLVGIVRGLRAVGRLKNWDEIQGAARQAITLAQRSDLQMKNSESLGSWMIRLEGVLEQSCKESVAAP